jgi:hypothetical protein
MTKVPSFAALYEYILCGYWYIKNYFSASTFKDWHVLQSERNKEQVSENTQEESILSGAKNMNLPKWLIYIPLINIITLFDIHSNKRIHILNGLGITIVALFSLIVILYDWNYLFFLLFPMTYGYAFLDTKLTYKLPLLYDI